MCDRDKFRAEEVVEHRCAAQEQHVRDEPEFVFGFNFDLFSSFFAGSAFQFLAHIRLLTQFLGGFSHYSLNRLRAALGCLNGCCGMDYDTVRGNDEGQKYLRRSWPGATAAIDYEHDYDYEHEAFRNSAFGVGRSKFALCLSL